MEELTANTFWKITYADLEMPKTVGYLGEAQTLAARHDTKSVIFYVTVKLTTPTQATEKNFNQKELTECELNSLTPTWVDEQVNEAFKMAKQFWGIREN